MWRGCSRGAGLLLLGALLAWAADDPPALIRQAFEAGHYAEAAAALEQASRQNPNDAETFFWLGRCYYEMRNWKEAVSRFERAVRLEPQNSAFHLWLGRAYGRQAEAQHSFWLGMKTRHEFEEAVRLDPRNLPARRDLAEFYSEAPWILGGSQKKARAEVEAIAALDPIQGMLARAELEKNKNLDRALAEYRRVLDAQPTRPEPLFEAAEFFANHDDLDDLQRAIQQAVRLAPTDPRLSFYRGVAGVLAGGPLDEAAQELKAYLARVPDRSDYPSHAEARTWLGLAYEKQGKWAAAAEEYRAALARDPDQGRARAGLKRLEKNRLGDR